MKYCGIDLHSNKFTCCFIHENSTKEIMTFAVSRNSIESFISFLDRETLIIVEASTNTFKFVEAIQNYVKDVMIVNTYRMKMIPLSHKKTDKIDAEKLAIYLKMCVSSGEELIKPVYLPMQIIQDLRSLFTTYNLIKRHIGSIKNRIHALLKQNLQPYTKEYIFGKKSRENIRDLKIGEISGYQLNLLFDELEAKELLIGKIEDKIKMIGFEYIKEIEILTSMKGMSVFTALAIISDIGTIERFPNSKHFTSYLRSAPEVDSSNESTIIRGTNKLGRKLSVTLLSQSLNHFRDSNPRLNQWYSKKEAFYKRKGKLRMALCRKVFAEVYHMLSKHEYHYYRDPGLHLKKMEEYYSFLKASGILLKSA
jgi:transposase